MRIRIILFIFVILPVRVTGQDCESDLAKAVKIYQETSYEIEMEHQLYALTYNENEPLERESVWIRRSGESYHVKYFGMEIISNQAYEVFINRDFRVLCVGRKTTVPVTEVREDTAEMAEIKEMFAKAFSDYITSLGLEIDTSRVQEKYKCHYEGAQSGKKVYRFEYPYGKYTEATVWLSGRTGLIEKISAYLREPLEVSPGIYSRIRLDMVYHKQVSGEKYPDREFSTDGIFHITSGGDLELQPGYKHYELINHINN